MLKVLLMIKHATTRKMILNFFFNKMNGQTSCLGVSSIKHLGAEVVAFYSFATPTLIELPYCFFSRCHFMNFARNKICFKCEEPRPKRQLNPGEWECPSYVPT